MTKRTSINLDMELVEQAKQDFGTTETTETIHHALSEAVRHARLRRLTQRRFDFGDADLDAIRRSRTEAGARPVSAKVSS